MSFLDDLYMKKKIEETANFAKSRKYKDIDAVALIIHIFKEPTETIGFILNQAKSPASESIDLEIKTFLEKPEEAKPIISSSAKSEESKPIAFDEEAGFDFDFVEKNEEKYLEKEHIQTPFEKAYIFKNFVRDEGFDDGAYTFQSVGSIAICSVVSPCEKMLDACAAPGGKSVLLAKKCGEVTAFEFEVFKL